MEAPGVYHRGIATRTASSLRGASGSTRPTSWIRTSRMDTGRRGSGGSPPSSSASHRDRCLQEPIRRGLRTRQAVHEKDQGRLWRPHSQRHARCARPRARPQRGHTRCRSSLRIIPETRNTLRAWSSLTTSAPGSRDTSGASWACPMANIQKLPQLVCLSVRCQPGKRQVARDCKGGPPYAHGRCEFPQLDIGLAAPIYLTVRLKIMAKNLRHS